MAAAPQSSHPVSTAQRVKYANLSVTKDGVFERPDPSWSNDKLDDIRSLQAEPWNVEGTTISGQGIEVSQYAGDYDHDDSQVGSRVLKEDEIAWSVLFRQASMKDIRVREMSRLPTTKAKTPLTFIEICFKYEGVPVSKDATRFKTVGPEEAEGTTTEEREMNEQGQEGKGKEGEREAEEGDEEVGEGAREEEEEMEVGAGYIEVELEDEPPADELNLAKLFVEPNEYNNFEVRIAFLRSPSKRRPFQWMWPAVFVFLRGQAGWKPWCKPSETQVRVGLSLDDYISRFESLYGQLVAQPQEDKTIKWLMTPMPDRQKQQPSTASPAVPAFGAPLPKAPRPTSTPTPTPTSESSQGSRKRRLEEIHAEEEEIDREEERLIARLIARRRQLREERKQFY